jgi:phosphoadenosine phosphosulfate reductase
MGLVASARHTAHDIDSWRRTEDQARAWAATKVHAKRVRKSRDHVLSFTGGGRCYAGVSWGKDSVVLAHLVATLVPRVPMVWIRVRPIDNPDCGVVRDAFVGRFPQANYHEIETWCTLDGDGWHARGTLERGFSEAASRFGGRHLSGIRGEESGQRKRRMMAFGASTKNTCAPIGWWTGLDVFAYLVAHDLPIHPAYACAMHGTFDPQRIRVASLGGKRGTGKGREEWERFYYRNEMLALDRGEVPRVVG